MRISFYSSLAVGMIFAESVSAVETHDDDYDYSLAQLDADYGSVAEKDLQDWMLA